MMNNSISDTPVEYEEEQLDTIIEASQKAVSPPSRPGLLPEEIQANHQVDEIMLALGEKTEAKKELCQIDNQAAF